MAKTDRDLQELKNLINSRFNAVDKRFDILDKNFLFSSSLHSY